MFARRTTGAWLRRDHYLGRPVKPYRLIAPARITATLTVAALTVALAGCGSSAGDDGAKPSGKDPSPTTPSKAAAPEPTLKACDLLTPDQVSTAMGKKGLRPTSVRFETDKRLGLLDTCSFGPVVDSFNVTVHLGTVPATKADIKTLGKPLPGIGDAAVRRAGQGTQVSLIKGTTYADVGILNFEDDPSLPAVATKLARQLAAKLPSAPPAAVGVERDSACDGLDTDALTAYLGGDVVGSRSVNFPDGSATCAWVGPATATASLVLNKTSTASENSLSQKDYLEFAPMPDVDKQALAFPGSYVAPLTGGGAVTLYGPGGQPPGKPRKPAPVTPQVTALMKSALTLGG